MGKVTQESATVLNAPTALQMVDGPLVFGLIDTDFVMTVSNRRVAGALGINP
jgi:hypothetical protein